MSDTALHLRDATRREVARRSPPERIALAFALGEDDLRLFMAASGLDRDAALARLRAARARGRRPSRAAGG